MSKLFPMSKRKNMSSDAENNENSENMASNKKQKKGILYRYEYIGKFFLVPEFLRACSKMKSVQWGFSFKKS